MFSHSQEFRDGRIALGLQNLTSPAYYDPSAAVIITEHGSSALDHEILHLNQLSATTAGLATTAALAYRNMCIEFRVRTLSEKFDAGLWSPILGWLDELHQGHPNEFHDPAYPYYHLSYLKRWIGSADSLLYALGYFDTVNDDDVEYWFQRFPWKHHYQQDDWLRNSFDRKYVPGAWMTIGVRSLLESSALYLELLDEHGNTDNVNELLWRKFNSGRWAHGPPNPEERDFVYFGAFTEAHWGNDSGGPPPYQLIPICGYWALNGPLPHFSFRDEMAIRTGAHQFTWGHVSPPAIFSGLLQHCIRQPHPVLNSCSGLATESQKLTPVVDGMFGADYLAKVASEDERYISVCLDELDLGLSFRVALEGIRGNTDLLSRLEKFFRYPPHLPLVANYQVVSPNSSSATTENLQALFISNVAEHLVPTWSERAANRFRKARRLRCPSIEHPGRPLCPAKSCSGEFPDTSGLPAACWFQEAAKQTLHLNVKEIGIVDGYEP